MEVLRQVRRTVRQHGLAAAQTRVLAAVSGGSDSVALVHLLRALTASGELCLVGLAHFNHQLRLAADADERFCQDVARRLDLPLVIGREDVGAAAREHRISIEDAAHRARYRFFERARGELNAAVVAVGHTRDDQAETFLLRLLRGAGARGLAAMHYRNGSIIRPLLDCRRGALRAYLESERLAFVEDESNRDVSIPRNRIRAALLPLLEQDFNPSVVEILAAEATLAREAWDLLQHLTDDWRSRVVARVGNRWSVDCHGLSSAPSAVRRAVIWRTMSEAAGQRDIAFGDVERALQLVETGGPGFDAHGQRVDRAGSSLVLTSRPPDWTARIGRSPKDANFFQYPLSIPGEVALREARLVLSAEAGASASAVRAVPGNGFTALVRRDLCGTGLIVRSRGPGDRFRPVGLGGQKKLQDFFVDKKVARSARDQVPIIVDQADRIVWVGGYAIAEDFRVTDAAQAVLVLRLKPMGGSV